MRRASSGFSLVELAVVAAIVALLLGSAMMTLSAQAEQRAIDETRRRLDTAAEALVSFAVMHGRLPCPAVNASTGDEAPAGGGACTNPYGGFLPARSIGMQPTDGSFYAIDAWGNRIRYAVSSVAPTGCSGTSNAPHFTHATNLKTNGLSCKPNDLDIVCSSVAAGVNAACNTGVRVVSAQTIAFVVFSTGANGALVGSYGVDEIENANSDARFVSRTRSASEATNGTYDDLVVAVPAGVLYSRLVAAGVLP
ncbi:MAG TPA: type II secretion system protein [Burkholderiales bacterium]|nr:type II secretion system protein [Burkholderiales bacterium]